MIGKWYKCNSTENDENFTTNKWYKSIKDPREKEAFIGNDGKRDGFYPFNPCYFDLSNPMDYNPDEVKEEVKEPDLKIETITIVVINDEKYITNTVFDLKQLVKHLKEVTYRLDKQINEG